MTNTNQNPFLSKPTTQLKQVREAYLKDLANPATTPAARAMVQNELALVNAAIKENNIRDAREAKSLADRRKAAGQKEHVENHRRAVANTKASSPEPQRGELPAATTCPDDSASDVDVAAIMAKLAPPDPHPVYYPKGIKSRGELILLRAEQLQKAIRRIRVDRLPFTDAFLPLLDAFIAQQKPIVAAERADRSEIRARALAAGDLPAVSDAPHRAERPPSTHPSSSPVEWAETWND